jgi:hypothetical protein
MPKTSNPPRKKPVVKKTRQTAKKHNPKTSTAAVALPAKARGIHRLNYQLWRNNRAISIKQKPALASTFRLTQQTGLTLWRYKQIILGVVVVYGILNIVLVQGLANNADISNVKSELTKGFHGNATSAITSVASFIVLVGSSGNGSSSTAGAYQFVLILMASLAIIWSLRQSLAGVRVGIRDAYYKGMYPLVPFVLVLLTIGLQLLPLLIGATLYTIVMTNGIAVLLIEKIAWTGLFVVFAGISMYFVSSSVFALYVVTLPDMTPLKALRSARELVRYRRWTILLRVLFLPVLLLLAAAIIMVPIITLLTPLTKWMIFLLSMIAIAVVHSYMYSLYRELLHE